MPDESATSSTTIADPAVAESVAAAPAVEAKTFTQDQLNAIVQERLAKDRANRPAPATAAPVAKPTEETSNKPVSRAEFEELQRMNTEISTRAAFDKRVAKFDLDEERDLALFDIYKANPAGFDKTVSLFGLKSPTTIPATNVTTQTVAPIAAAAPAAPSAHTLPTAAGVIDLFNLNSAQLASLGAHGVRENLEKLWAQGNQASGAPTRLKPPSPR